MRSIIQGTRVLKQARLSADETTRDEQVIEGNSARKDGIREMSKQGRIEVEQRREGAQTYITRSLFLSHSLFILILETWLKNRRVQCLEYFFEHSIVPVSKLPLYIPI
jgi:hypothetical protein